MNYAGEFRECKPCADKPGSPTLCDSCLHNRRTIGELKNENKELWMIIDCITKIFGHTRMLTEACLEKWKRRRRGE